MTDPTAPMAARLVDGDESALADCYHDYSATIRAYLRRYLPEPDIDDVVQITFLEVWRSRQRLDPTRRLEPWLFAIARRRAIDHLRRRKTVLEVSVLRDLVGENGNEVADRFAWAAEVQVALGELSAEQRESLELAYFEGLTQSEIADRLGIPLGTVKARTARGLHRLASILEGDRR